MRGLEAAHKLDALSSLGSPIPHKAWQCDGGQIAHGGLLRGGVLEDLCAQIAAADCAQVLLVGLAVACVLVQHVWVSGLHLPGQALGQPTCQLQAECTLSELFRMLSPSSAKRIPVRSSLQLSSRMRQDWLPVQKFHRTPLLVELQCERF